MSEGSLPAAPDPLHRPGLSYEPVLNYEQVLVVAGGHPLAAQALVTPDQLCGETLITYPVDIERLDIYNQFLLPAGCQPKRHKTTSLSGLAFPAAGAIAAGAGARSGKGLRCRSGSSARHSDATTIASNAKAPPRNAFGGMAAYALGGRAPHLVVLYFLHGISRRRGSAIVHVED